LGIAPVAASGAYISWEDILSGQKVLITVLFGIPFDPLFGYKVLISDFSAFSPRYFPDGRDPESSLVVGPQKRFAVEAHSD
jgi:hypothetical protein